VAAVRLGFQYIWIDSLCIIQDDKDDWDIYACSVLNFAATSAKDGAGSCYFARSAANIKDLSPIKLRVPSRGAGRSTYLYATAVPWQAEGIKSPLLSRGWVVQERALSRRILHFGRTQFYWECSELAGCEAFPDGLPELGDLITRNPKGDPGKFLGTAEGWDTIANAYCEKSLTYVKDSLTAVCSCASSPRIQWRSICRGTLEDRARTTTVMDCHPLMLLPLGRGPLSCDRWHKRRGATEMPSQF
jgi:hypothetical protein